MVLRAVNSHCLHCARTSLNLLLGAILAQVNDLIVVQASDFPGCLLFSAMERAMDMTVDAKHDARREAQAEAVQEKLVSGLAAMEVDVEETATDLDGLGLGTAASQRCIPP